LSARNRELFGLIPVAIVVTAGFTAVFIVESEQLGNLSVLYGLYFLGLCVAAHLLIRARLPDADPFLFPLMALLAAFGLVMIYRINEDLARDQANWFVLGLVVFGATIVFLRDYGALERYRYVIALTGIGLLLLPRLFGQTVNEAYLAIDLGAISFQPTELAKICIVVFLASYLREKREVLVVGARRIAGITFPPLKHLGPLLVVWGAAMLMLILIRDLGSSLMFFGAFLAVLYVATARLSFVVIGLGMFLLGSWLIAGQVAHVEERFDIWLDPFKPENEEAGYQVAQSLFAQADGGLFGRGLADSLIQLPRLPEGCTASEFPNCGAILPAPHTDFIYAVIVNELGLFGGAAVVLIYALITARGFKTALLADDGFSKLLATGLTAVFALQAFVIIGGVTRVIPLTGVTLPFISYGGSSILANFILLALLLMVSDSARRRARLEEERAWEEAA
jgi:cell division protein FtsW (lipid II flippase)